MKKLSKLFVFLFFASISLHAQKVYFIYLQTDNQQPFFARMGDKIYNSTTSGYLILSNLHDSIYSVNIGIQGSEVTDQPYSISISKKDQGFLIKNFGEKGWGLFNLTSMATIMPQSKSANSAQNVKTEKREDNAFTNLLAKAADDSTIKEKPVIEKPVEKKAGATATNTEKKEEVKEIAPSSQSEIKNGVPSSQSEIKNGIIVAPVVIKEEPKIDGQDSKNAAKMKEDSIAAAKAKDDELLKQEELRKQDSMEKAKTQINTESEYKRSVVKLKSESSTTTGIGLVFLDVLSDQVTDTIKVLIQPDTKKATPVQSNQDEKKFLDIPPVDSVAVNKETTQKTVVKSNNCKAVAVEDDFFKIRKRMAAANNDEAMIAEAKKAFKTKCFSTTQVRNLSALFLTDESKYKFFDIAYQYVSDLENFSTLQSALKDEYFINRFKAMIH
ncbi:MAG TPA: DUF4476 domain-containing protein [Chitinophagaceae bacterium]|nr:DUF4476 domain-containing protein [Chitinophagaceae bacterium]